MLVVSLCFGGVAEAREPTFVRFDYLRQDGIATCPDEAAIRTGVAARLGYDPFRSDASDQLRTTIDRSGNALEARIVMTDAHGAVKAERKLLSRARDCVELASSVELAISIAIDPMRSMPSAEPESRSQNAGRGPDGSARASGDAAEPTGGPTSGPLPVATPLPSEPSPPIVKRIVAAATGGLWAAPSPNLGILAGVGLRRGNLSVTVDVRADWPAARSLKTGTVSSALYLGTLAPCIHHRWVAACALASAGARRVSGHGLLDARAATDAYVALGARLGIDLPLTARLAVALHGDVTAPVTRMHLLVDDEVVWTSPLASVALGIGLAAIFP
jgi:hypothetical protein